MRQVIKHREIRLLKMTRRTDPVIPENDQENRPRDSPKMTRRTDPVIP